MHIPTGLSVKCTQERTQIMNRAIAMEMLRAKLLVVLEEQQAKEVCMAGGGCTQCRGMQIGTEDPPALKIRRTMGRCLLPLCPPPTHMAIDILPHPRSSPTLHALAPHPRSGR